MSFTTAMVDISIESYISVASHSADTKAAAGGKNHSDYS